MAPIRKSASTGPGSPDVWGIYEPDTGSIQYILADPSTRKAALVDVVWNYDPKHAYTSTHSADEVLGLVAKEGLEVEWVLDTHPHADHLMASAYLGGKTGAPTAIGEKIREIAELWRGYYNEPDAFDVDRDFTRLFADAERFTVGGLDVDVILSPGHTLGSITYVCGDAALVHDTLMYPDSGTARADFPGGTAAELWDSIQRILALPDATRLFVGHDYPSDGRDEPAWEATVAEHKAGNVHLKDGRTKAEYVEIREARDATLALPDRMLAALQINLRGGRLPDPESDGRSYLRIPVNVFTPAEKD